jgi:hypothetical protein
MAGTTEVFVHPRAALVAQIIAQATASDRARLRKGGSIAGHNLRCAAVEWLYEVGLADSLEEAWQLIWDLPPSVFRYTGEGYEIENARRPVQG